MNKLFWIASLLVPTFFCSCEGVTHREFLVQNNSQSSFSVEAVGPRADTIITVILPDEEVTITNWESLGGQAEAGDPGDYLPHFLVYNEVDTAQINYEQNNAWNVCSTHDSKLPSAYTHIFVLKVGEDDF